MIDIELDIGVNDMPKRRRAMLNMLDNPRGYSLYAAQLGHSLCDVLKANNHPQCAYAISMRLSGVRVRMIGSEVKIIE